MMRESRPAEYGNFRRRCEAALTHPVTLASLALLLANDVVLKALFPGAWAVGKLSDLAWMSFAPPLLAFLLSFAVPKSAAGRRVALAIAYGGLPLLYAAFNTFAPVHGAIMRALLIGADGGAVGSPMDATDSLVIPFGLALAICAWRRSAESAGGGTRRRFGLLVAGIAAFASVATSQSPPVEGIAAVGVTNDGTVAAISNIYGDMRGEYISDDGGMSWSPRQNDEEPINLEEAVWPSQRVETPRGEYFITGSGVERAGEGGGRELVHSTKHLRGDANKWMQERDLQFDGDRYLATRPKGVNYHAESGNVIAAMGIQGVVVETPDGRWHRVAVGPYSPTDFSYSAKMSALRESSWSVAAIALALSLSALSVAAAASAYERQAYNDDIGQIIAFSMLLALGCLGMFAAMSSIPAFAAPVATLLSLIAMIIAAAKSEGAGKGWFALFGCALTLPLALALPSVRFAVFANPSSDVLILSSDEIFAALTFAAVVSLLFPLGYHARFIARRWIPFALAFAGMNALVVLSFVVWLTLNLSLPATQVAIAVLVGLAAVVLVRHVRGADAGEWR